MKYFPLVAIIAFFLSPDLVSADFVPCGGASQPACTECYFVVMANTILKWLIGVLFVVFGVVMAVAGFGLATSGGNPSALEAAKSKMVNGLIGLVIVLGSWLLVDTVMRGLLQGGTGTISGFGPWSEVKCGKQNETTTVPASGAAAVPAPASGSAPETEGPALDEDTFDPCDGLDDDDDC